MQDCVIERANCIESVHAPLTRLRLALNNLLLCSVATCLSTTHDRVTLLNRMLIFNIVS